MYIKHIEHTQAQRFNVQTDENQLIKKMKKK